MLDRIFIRWRAWWFNKVPLSVTTVLLLVDGRALQMGALSALVLVVLAVCAIGNCGYALNDLFDMDEDARAGRANAAASLGRGRIWAAIVVSALAALAIGALAAGGAGAGLTLAAVALPFAYSVPPLRLKERGWWGVAADALAAHVYPAGLALLSVAHLDVRPIGGALIACLLAWSAATGLRGILSHLLHTADRDARAGLATLVHDGGRRPLERLIVWGLLPVEAAAFVGAVALCDGGPVLWMLGGLYLASEAFRTFDRRFSVTALRPQGQRYVPFVEESFYKAWGPVVLAADAARADLRFLILIPICGFLFRRHLASERHRLRAIWHALRRPTGAD